MAETLANISGFSTVVLLGLVSTLVFSIFPACYLTFFFVCLFFLAALYSYYTGVFIF